MGELNLLAQVTEQKYRELTMILSLTIFVINPCFAAGYNSKFTVFLLPIEVKALEGDLSQAVEDMDNTSGQCMRCHNGSRGRKIVTKSAGAPMHFEGHMNTNHPVGMNYGNYAANHPHDYISLQKLDKAILLNNGKVGCISCHMLKNNMQVSSVGFIKVGLSNEETNPLCAATKKKTVANLCQSCHTI